MVALVITASMAMPGFMALIPGFMAKSTTLALDKNTQHRGMHQQCRMMHGSAGRSTLVKSVPRGDDPVANRDQLVVSISFSIRKTSARIFLFGVTLDAMKLERVEERTSCAIKPPATAWRSAEPGCTCDPLKTGCPQAAQNTIPKFRTNWSKD